MKAHEDDGAGSGVVGNGGRQRVDLKMLVLLSSEEDGLSSARSMGVAKARSSSEPRAPSISGGDVNDEDDGVDVDVTPSTVVAGRCEVGDEEEVEQCGVGFQMIFEGNFGIFATGFFFSFLFSFVFSFFSQQAKTRIGSRIRGEEN